MSRRTFTGREVATALLAMGYGPVDRAGIHLTLRYSDPDTGEVRNVTVPIHGELASGVLRSIADQAGATEFDAWCDQVEAHL